jgi:hypothetical protein
MEMHAYDKKYELMRQWFKSPFRAVTSCFLRSANSPYVPYPDFIHV